MERIDSKTVMVGRDETAENILEHNELFGLDFGKAGTIKQTIGQRQTGDINPTHICIHFRTGDRTEVNVGYSVMQSMMERVMYKGKFTCMVSEQPWAHAGDEGNLFEYNGTSKENPCITFLSADGKDPRKGFTRKGYVQTPSGYRLGDVEVPPRPDGGYRPNTDYYFTFRWIRETGGNIPVLNVHYVGTDEPEYGGERLIANSDLVQSGVAIPFALGELTGVFIPD